MTADIDSQMRTFFQVTRFYNDEAALLDERLFDDWVALFTDDVHYWMPVRRTVSASQSHLEFTPHNATALFDDDKATLLARIRKLKTGFSWSEDPPSRTRHLITNIRVREEKDGELKVDSNFHHYRTRLNSEEDSWIGKRSDVLRRSGGSFMIARRHVFLEQTVILSRNLSGFF